MTNFDFNILSLNVRGLNDKIKRHTIFRYLKRQKCDIAFLQETFSSESEEQKWLNDWGGQGIFVHGTKHSRGVATLFRKGLDYTIEFQKKDIGGRFLLLKVLVKDEIFYLLNLYAPNTENKQIQFYREVKRIMELESISRKDNIILGGDFNLILDPDKDKSGGNLNIKGNALQQLNSITDNFDLLDIWRIKNYHVKRFTWRQKTPKIQCRLDYWFVSNNLCDNVTNVDIKPSVRSDHSAIYLALKYLPEVPKGPSHWKFNTSLLEDDNYVTSLKYKIADWIEIYKNIENLNTKWELLKYEVRKFSISYSKKKKQNRVQRENEIEERLTSIEEYLDNQDDLVIDQEYNCLKSELENIESEKSRAAIIQSRALWSEKGEKSTSYFFNLQKSNYIKKTARKLLSPQGIEITDPKKILNMQCEYYKTLYSERPVNLNELDLFNMETIPKLSALDQYVCEGLITVAEAYEILNSFDRNKTPGNDGLPAEFYLKFWDILGVHLVNGFNYSYENGLLSTSQRQAIITLIDKKGKDRLYIKNWRPISLLNVDYKVLSKCLAERLKPLLPKLIHHNQTGFVKDRNISEGLRTILDIIEDTKLKDMHGLLMTIDFEKAFDSLSWEYLFRTLEAFNFSQPFIDWIKLLYTNISSCIMNNNTTSTYFDILRGVRQGDPLSPYLFILAIELLAIYLRNRNDIHGLKFNGEEIKILTYADDTTAIVETVDDAKRLLETLKKFKTMSGLSVNESKSEGLWLGLDRHSNRKPLGISWPKQIKLLGIYIGYNSNTIQSMNFNEKLAKMKTKFNIWRQRDLSIKGKILIIKTFGLSQLLYVSSILYVPDWVISEAENIMYNFLWNGKQHKVKKRVIIQDVKDGGLNMSDLLSVVKTQRIKWIKRYLNATKTSWKNTMSSICNINKVEYFLDSNYDLLCHGINSEFYNDVFRVWKEIKYTSVQSSTDILNQNIWYNHNIKINKKITFYEDWLNNGIEKLHQIYKRNGTLKSYPELCQEFDLNVNHYMRYNSLCHAIPKQWKLKIKENPVMAELYPKYPVLYNEEITQVWEIDNRSIYTTLVKMKKDVSKAYKYYSEHYDITEKEWADIYSLPHQLKIDNKVMETHYKIVHRYLATNKLLHKIGKIESPRCNLCFIYTQDIEHMLYSCNIVRNFWFQLCHWIKESLNKEINLSINDILFGNSITNSNSLIDKIVMCAKHYICKCKYNDNNPSLHVFTDLLKSKFSIVLNVGQL